jgi:hypothetical protein
MLGGYGVYEPVVVPAVALLLLAWSYGGQGELPGGMALGEAGPLQG